MTRSKLAILIAIVIAFGALILMFRPGHEGETHAQEEEHGREGAETRTAAGMISLTDQQVREAGIKLSVVRSGAAVGLVFPATIATSQNGSARIDARASGIVRSVGKTLGDAVSQGETVARIESAEAAGLAAQLSAARARVTELSAALRRERQLFDAAVTARQDLEASQANLRVAQSELQRAQAAAAAAGVSGDGRSLAVTSPLSGRVTAAPIVLGAFVNAGDELYRIVDPRGLQVEVAVPSADASRVQPGDDAALIVGDGREIGARVRAVTPSLDPESRSATAVLSLPGVVSGLQPGAFMQARIRLSGEVDHTRIAVPEDAVQLLEGQDVVFVRTRNGFAAREVEVGTRSAGMVTILSGLKEGWRIATGNAFLLKAELEKEGAEHGH